MDNKIYIIGGGPSLKGFNWESLRDKDTVTINKSVFYVPNPNYFITMDFLFMKNYCDKEALDKLNNASKFFVANLACLHLEEIEGRFIDTRINWIYDLSDFDTIIKSYHKRGIGMDWHNFKSGNNSGFCALQLALLLNYKEIYLLGFDLNVQQGTHFHEGYTNNFLIRNINQYFNYFEVGLKQLSKKSNAKVYSCSPTSRLNKIIPYKKFEETL